MKFRSIVAGAAFVVLPVLGVAYAQSHGHGSGGHGGQMTHGASGSMDGSSMQQMMAMMAPKPDDTPFVRAFKEVHMKMMREMHLPLSGNPDRDFVRHMTPHHQGAIDMARIQLQYGTDPELRQLADSIIKDQEREIAQMNAWSQRNAK